MSITLGLDFILRELGSAAPQGYYVALHIRFASPLVLYQTYDQRWIDHYTEQSYVLRDPMVAWGFSATGACRWSEIELPDPFDVFGQAASFGMKFGVAVACGSMQSRSIGGVARSDREFSDEEIGKISALINTLHRQTEPPEYLTDAQKEALQLIANGDRYAAAAAKLGISESALKARLTSARNRLMARTTAEAIQRAKDYKLL